ncbi:MAG: acetyl-CoA acyltransferase [Rickettsiaceae bacterium]|jgi:acetyl-CoA C-acetyltransferase/acetyl-CoA acyltransferase|nr:acetyl-CoA acyltransferase [Rickettsiaceae bacterium]
MRERIAIIGGFRTPMGKAGGALKNVSADDLAVRVVKELVIRTNIDVNKIDEVIFGNVAQPANAANIARVIALKAGLPQTIPAYTVHRNCASGMEAVTSAASKIWAGEAEIILVGGTESMSNIPLLFNRKMTNLFATLFKAKSLSQKLFALIKFRPSFLKPVIGIEQGLTDPVSGLIMGCTAEAVAKEFAITRTEQDEFAVMSHNRAEAATTNGIFKDEIIPVFNNDEKNSKMIEEDEGIRKGQKLEGLAKLKPYFERDTGTVTVGNSSQLTDGAAAMIVMKESKAKELGLEVLGYLKDFAYAGLDPRVMGLGPVYATSKVLSKTGLNLSDMELIEINEAFAAQVIGCERAFASDDFCKRNLGRDKAMGTINRDITNVNGGAVALGHPVGMTGARIIVHLLRELKRRGKNRGLATLCVGGGQGGSCILEVK